ncbi:hypothetical protein HDV06_002169 [Boothiomyces sp. JEL0866]|nr:hypothetical protein HDV06_002169 [Boothiomyces sp. JEL0866]
MISLKSKLESATLIPTLLAMMYMCNKYLNPKYRSKSNYKVMLVFLFILSLCAIRRLLSFEEDLSVFDMIFNRISMDVCFLAIAVFNYQTLFIFSILDQRLIQIRWVSNYYTGIAVFICLLNDAYFIFTFIGNGDMRRSQLIAEVYGIFVMTEDNIQSVYLAILIYKKLHVKSNQTEVKASFMKLILVCGGLLLFDWICVFLYTILNPMYDKGDNDLCFNILSVHCICLSLLFSQFKNLAIIKIKSKVAQLKSSNHFDQVVYSPEVSLDISTHKCVKHAPKILRTSKVTSDSTTRSCDQNKKKVTFKLDN